MDTDRDGWKAIGRHREKVAVCRPRREASEETNLANTLISEPSES